MVLFLWLSAATQAVANLCPDLQAISRKYQIELQVANLGLAARSPRELPLLSEPFGAKELRRYASLFAAEFELYPLELIRDVGLKRVVFCKRLNLGGQPRAAVPDFRLGVLYVDINPREYYPIYLRQVLHHEFYHMIDFRQDGLRDETWAALNQPGFKYGSGGGSAQTFQTTAWATREYPGFLNHYSTTAVEEDKAEIFSNLMVVPKYVERRAEADRILSSKVMFLRRSLKSFCPAISGQFWNKARMAHTPFPMIRADISITSIFRAHVLQPLPAGCALGGVVLLVRCEKARRFRTITYASALLLCSFISFAQAAFRIWWEYARVEPLGFWFKTFWPALEIIGYATLIAVMLAHWIEYKRRAPTQR